MCHVGAVGVLWVLVAGCWWHPGACLVAPCVVLCVWGCLCCSILCGSVFSCVPALCSCAALLWILVLLALCSCAALLWALVLFALCVLVLLGCGLLCCLLWALVLLALDSGASIAGAPREHLGKGQRLERVERVKNG